MIKHDTVHLTGRNLVTQACFPQQKVPEIGMLVPMQSHLNKSKEMNMSYKKNEVTPPGIKSGAQIKMIRRVTTVPRSRGI